MMNRRTKVRDYIISSLAIGMVIVIWVCILDAVIYGTWPILRAIASILGSAFILCFIQIIIRFVLDDRPWISLVAEYGVVLLLFFSYGAYFQWYPRDKGWYAFLYTIPVYAICYLLRLAGTKRDEKYINRKLEERKRASDI